ncbi:hypothetical protein EJ082_01355 [Brevundimonas diminuta]|uniref:hypothetical protein n=1 Tax=Brevundimonas diminuta TaxID=293 RepID=UPI00168C07F9|nr:hypothetical protein [Brevundimonas diminuta]MBD3571623.1 hypothetical protein [Brevundimonas diminuta]
MLSDLSPGFDLGRLRYAFGGAAGALIYGVYTFVQLVKAGHRPTLSDFWRALANVTAGLLVGTVAAFALGPAMVAMIPFEGLRAAVDPVAVGFVVGGLGWELLPLVIEGAKRWASRLGKEKSG